MVVGIVAKDAELVLMECAVGGAMIGGWADAVADVEVVVVAYRGKGGVIVA